MTDLETLAVALQRIIDEEMGARAQDPTILDLCGRLIIELGRIHKERGWQFDPDERPAWERDINVRR
jgi:hypothetical protein